MSIVNRQRKEGCLFSQETTFQVMRKLSMLGAFLGNYRIVSRQNTLLSNVLIRNSIKITLVFGLLLVPLMAKSQIFSKEAFEYANQKWAIGAMGGGLGIFDDKTRGVFGLNLTIKGVYVDFLGKWSSHKSDVRVDTWKESSGTVFHLGYQLPVTKTFRVIPVIGYYTLGSTTTDGHDWTATSSGISNKTSTSVDTKGVDYGGVLVFNLKHVNFYGACTRHVLYGGVAYQF